MPTSRVARVLLVVMSLLAAANWVVDSFAGGWNIVYGVFGMWLTLIGLCFGILPSVGLRSRSPNSCLINCAAVCLSYLGYSFDSRTLEKEMRLNQFGKGTRIQDFLQFLTNKSIMCSAFGCHDIAELSTVLSVAGGPLITSVGQPILYCTPGWKLVFSPLAALSSLFSWLFKRDVSHAIVVYGVIGKMILVYDPAFGILHRLSWSELSSWISPNVFFGTGSFLVVSKPASSRFSDASPLDLSGDGEAAWDATF